MTRALEIARSQPTVRTVGTVVLAVLMVVVPLAYGLQSASHKGYPSQIAVFSRILITPFMFLFPLMAALLGSRRMYSEVGHRYSSLLGSRTGMRRYLVGRLVRSAALPFFCFFVYAALAFVIAYFVWPELGNPGVDSSNYGMTSAQADRAEVADTSYSQLLQVGPLVYGVGYAAWIGVSAAVYSVAAVLCLVIMKNRLAAIAVPSALYLAQSVIMIALVGPQSTVVYSVFPFGLTQLPVLIAAAPQLVVDIVVILLAVYVLKAMRRKGYLT